jgi:hypothetical protein
MHIIPVRYLKSNSVNKSVHISKFNNMSMNLQNYINEVPKDKINSTKKGDNSNPEQTDKKQVGFPKIEAKNVGELKKTATVFKFNSKSTGSKKNFYDNLKDFSLEGDEKVIHFQNKIIKPVAIVSYKNTEIQFKSSHNSPRINLNDNKSDVSNDNIIPTKNNNFIYSKFTKGKNFLAKSWKEEGMNISTEINNFRKRKSFYGEECELFIKDKEDISQKDIEDRSKRDGVGEYKGLQKSCPHNVNCTNTTKDDSFASKNFNRRRSSSFPTKIYVESIEDMHYVYNNLYRQNRELAFKLDFEQNNIKETEIEL